jgi:hypothetical protein
MQRMESKADALELLAQATEADDPELNYRALNAWSDGLGDRTRAVIERVERRVAMGLPPTAPDERLDPDRVRAAVARRDS